MYRIILKNRFMVVARNLRSSIKRNQLIDRKGNDFIRMETISFFKIIKRKSRIKNKNYEKN